MEPRDGQARRVSAAPQGAGGPADVLLVDEDPTARELFTLLLEGHGFRVRGGADGKEALRLLREGPQPACIVLDL
jgi:CheY-like chemotaxis protein